MSTINFVISHSDELLKFKGRLGTKFPLGISVFTRGRQSCGLTTRQRLIRPLIVISQSLIIIQMWVTLWAVTHLFFAWVWWKFCRESYFGIAYWSEMTIYHFPSMAKGRRIVLRYGWRRIWLASIICKFRLTLSGERRMRDFFFWAIHLRTIKLTLIKIWLGTPF